MQLFGSFYYNHLDIVYSSYVSFVKCHCYESAVILIFIATRKHKWSNGE